MLVITIILLIIIIVLLIKLKDSANVNATDQIVDYIDNKLEDHAQTVIRINENHLNMVSQYMSELDRNLLRNNIQMKQDVKQFANNLDNKQEKQAMSLEERNVRLEKQLTKVISLDESLISLQEKITDINLIFNNSKSRGTFGEYQLESLLASFYGKINTDVIKQDKLSNGSISDITVFNYSANAKMCIDSKFPLENFIEFEQTSEIGFKNLFERDIKKHIDDISSKYIINGETTNFALMFVPSEAIYLAILDSSKLVEYSFKKKVWITSPTTILSLLTMLDNVSKNNKRIKNVDQILSEVDKLEIEFERLNKRYNNLYKHIQQVNVDSEDLRITHNKIINRFNSLKNMEIEDINE